MHMARLVDPTRGPKSYSLANLTQYYEKTLHATKQRVIENLLGKKDLSEHTRQTLIGYQSRHLKEGVKISMSRTFTRRKVLKNGELGKTYEMPSFVEIYTSLELLPKMIQYSAFDADATFFLREALVSELTRYKVNFEDMNNLFDLYTKYWLPFGEVLTDLERSGIRVDLNHLAKAEVQALQDIKNFEETFIKWVTSIQPSAVGFNPSSTQQLQQLLYAPFKRKAIDFAKEGDPDLNLKDFPENQEEIDQDGNSEEARISIIKKPRNIDIINEFPEVREFQVENNDVRSG
jgi:DNA polymerase I-like protein with 3'-5' exonuclease and polymerase domains